jgi:hypothetical protein
MTDVRCACSRLNHAWRSYCGRCGLALEPRCDCGFVNDVSDRFCGGCGVAMVSRLRGSSPEMKRTPLRTSSDEVTVRLEIIKDALSGEPR